MNRAIYELVREGSKLDWISPMWGAVEVLMCGNGYRFSFAVGPRSGQDIVSVLHGRSIRTYAHGFDPWTETIHFRVSKNDVNEASRLLGRGF